jgi:DinB superfamily
MKRPEANEYAEFYANYIAKVPGTDVLSVLESQRAQMKQLFVGMSEQDGNFRYAPGKWTIKEVLGHITDSERIFAYRALRIARGDRTPLPGFEQDDYVRDGNFGARTLADLTEEFGAVRTASIALYRSLDESALERRGIANQKEVTVRALAFITVGHQMHHRLILEEKYLPGLAARVALGASPGKEA